MALPTFGAGLSSVIAGPYIGLWNGLEIGHVTEEGMMLRPRQQALPIVADITGEGTVIDKINVGVSVQISFTLEHWNAQAMESLIWWFGNAVPASYTFGKTDGVGQRHFDHAKPLVLTACHSVGGATASPANPTIDPLDLTAPRTLLSDGQDLQVLLATRPRYIPMVLDVFPVDSSWSPASPEVASRPVSCSNFIYFDCTRNPDYFLP